MIVHVAEAAAALQAHDDILILTHRRPDGDTAGCAGALCRGLRQIGKRAYILENPEITRRYAPMITNCYPPDDFNPQYIVSTDIAEEKLFPDTAEQYKGRVDLVIDHHGSNEGFGAKNLIRADAGAGAEVLYDVLTALGCRLTREIARPMQDILYDPQTSGGLLIALPEEDAAQCLDELRQSVPQAAAVGYVTEKMDADIYLE